MKKSETKTKAKKTSKTRVREPVERARYTKQLPVRATKAEQLEAGKRLAVLYREHETVLEKRRSVMAGFREKISGIHENMDQAATTFEDGTKLEPVEVVERLVVETNEIQIVRLDTGEIVETKAATAEDRQETMFAEGKPKVKLPKLHLWLEGEARTACGSENTRGGATVTLYRDRTTCSKCLEAAYAEEGDATAKRNAEELGEDADGSLAAEH
jgi:hypothetical protein